MLSILTPTYNRADKLKNLYQSLQKQVFKNFEWIIIDDGSTDNTKEVVEEFMNNNDMKIIYKYKENGGKMSAHNLGMEFVKGEFLADIDSDDIFMSNSLGDIYSECEKISNVSDIAGLGFLCIKMNSNDIIGTKFPQDEQIETFYNIYNKFNVTGDKQLVLKTNIMKKYLFPLQENEKFVPEALVFNRMSKEYKMKFINKEVVCKEYLEEGYSNNYFNLAKKNPKGQVLYYKELYELQPTLYNVAAYNMYSIFAKEGILKTIKEHPSKLKALLMYLPAVYKAKTKK